MTNFIPVLPLEIVVFPGEKLNLHITQPASRELIIDAKNSNNGFGISTTINGQPKELGCTVSVLEIIPKDDDTIDVRLEARKIFKILEVIPSIPDKKYGGAIVHYPYVSMFGSEPLMKKVLAGVREVLQLMDSDKVFEKPDDQLSSFDIAHRAGMPLQDEYILLELEHELHRQEFLKRYLEKTLPVLRTIHSMKEKVNLNGHFRNVENNPNNISDGNSLS
jgi:uncharacterized protein